MKKYSIILIALIITIIAALYWWTAKVAKTKSEELILKFKEVESSMDHPIDPIQSNTGIGAIEQVYPGSALKPQIILLIDSLKAHYFNNLSSPASLGLSKQLEPDFIRLLNDIKQFNKFKQEMVNSHLPDTVKYWAGKDKFSEQKWLSVYFNNEPKEAIITYLNYLKNQFLTLE